MQEALEFQASELRKFFKQGDHVKVLKGRYEGDTGLIIRVEENRVVLFSDLTMHELEVLPRDLQLCTDMATGVDSLGQFQWGDLVMLDAQTVGVIVRLEKESFQILSMSGKLVEAKPQTLQKKRENRNAQALDLEQNPIQVRDIVKVVDGPHAVSLINCCNVNRAELEFF
jgi:transcription elongation factor SPT5